MYSYQKLRPKIFTEEGMTKVRKTEAACNKMLDYSGAVTDEKLMVCSGNSWDQLAIIDYLVEIKVIRRVSESGPRQYWVYVRGTP